MEGSGARENRAGDVGINRNACFVLEMRDISQETIRMKGENSQLAQDGAELGPCVAGRAAACGLLEWMSRLSQSVRGKMLATFHRT